MGSKQESIRRAIRDSVVGTGAVIALWGGAIGITVNQEHYGIWTATVSDHATGEPKKAILQVIKTQQIGICPDGSKQMEEKPIVPYGLKKGEEVFPSAERDNCGQLLTPSS